MLKQLYYSKIHLKNIKIYLSKYIATGKYSEVNDVIKVHSALLIISRGASGCFVT